MQIEYRIATIACAIVIAACSSESGVGIDDALDAITEENLKATMLYLADDARNGRLAGSPGYEDAADYLAKKFEAIGLQPGGDDGWYQQVPLVAAAIDARNSGVILHTSAGDLELEWVKDAIVFPDAVREASRVRAEVVFAGFGIHAPELGYSDYEGIDVEGKIVATFHGGPGTFQEPQLAIYSSAEIKAAEESRPASAALSVDATLFQATRHERFSSPNVVGVLPGSDPELSDEYVVFSAHLDHIGTKDSDGEDVVFNGFLDNAMGVALMLESARALAKLTTPPRRSILFIAVTAEEDGLLGSDYFVNMLAAPAIVANINVDMPQLLFPMNTITTYGAERTSLEGPAAEEVLLEGFEARPDPYDDESEIRRSDQYSFAKQGIPFIWLAEGIGSPDPDIEGMAVFKAFLDDHYHKVTDDQSQPVHWDSARRFARAGARITRRIAMDDDAPSWNEGDFIGDKFSRD